MPSSPGSIKSSEHQPDRLPLQDGARGGTIRRFAHRKALFGEVAAKHGADLCLVVDHQNVELLAHRACHKPSQNAGH